MELSALQQKICDGVLANLYANRPSVIQIGQRGGKDFIINRVLSSSEITSALVVTPEPMNFKKRNEDIAFFDIISHNDFSRLEHERYCDRLERIFYASDYNILIMAEPWFWVMQNRSTSEQLFRKAEELFRGRVFAIGSYCETNIWSFDALIPKYASYETNPSIKDAVVKSFMINSIHSKRCFERNL